MGFLGNETPIMRMIALLLSIGGWPKISTKVVNFLIVYIPFAYNGIIGRPS